MYSIPNFSLGSYGDVKDVTFFCSAHMFCASRDGPGSFGFLRAVPTNSKVF